MAVITISRVFGSGGREFGQKLAGKLGYAYFDKELLPMISRKVGAAPGKVEAFEQDKWGIQKTVIDLLKTRYPKLDAKGIDEAEYMSALKEIIGELADRDNVIIVGRGGQCILANRPGTCHIRLVADEAYRIIHLREKHNMDRESDEVLARKIAGEDERRALYLDAHFNIDWNDATQYHLTINLCKVATDLAQALIIDTVKGC